MERLISILETRREHGSLGEASFIERFIKPLGAEPFVNPEGEIIAYVFDNNKSNKETKIMWSAHIDTMHRGKDEEIQQEVWVDVDGLAFVDDKADCLGADDGAGMWLLFEMIQADIEGVYVLHAGEEIGCWGSGEMVEHYTEWLKQFTHAIAFDRRGTTSIITHQRGERACSDALGNKLIELFGMRYELDTTGVYTDTAEYMGIIPECVNVSIGYDSEHSHFETLDTIHVLALRDAICALDWDKIVLPVARDPAVKETRGYGNNSWTDYTGGWSSKDDWSAEHYHTAGKLNIYEIPTVDRLLSVSARDLTTWVLEADPEDVANLIHTLAEQVEEADYALND